MADAKIAKKKTIRTPDTVVKQKKPRAKKLPVGLNSVVLYKKADDIFGENVRMREAREKMQPGIVRSYNPDRATVQFDQISTVTVGFGANIHPSFLEVLPEDKARDLRELIRLNDKKTEEENLRKRYGKYIKPVLPMMERTYESRRELQTNMNFIELGSLDKDWNFKVMSQNYWAQCCALTKTQNHVRVLIPELWLNYYGYDRNDVIRWIEFLSGCDMGFEARVYDPVPMSNFGKINEVDQGGQIMTNAMNVIPVVMSTGKSNMHTYMKFICIRYMYNLEYWHIPYTAMQLKEAIPELSNWEALIIANESRVCNGYYALFPGTQPGMIACIMPANNSAKEIIDRISPGQGVNGAFRSTSCEHTFLTQLRNAITNKNWDTVRELITPYTKLKQS